MGNMYTNRNSGLTVAMGKIKSIAEDRLSMVIEASEYVQEQDSHNPQVKKTVSKAVDVNVRSSVPFTDADYRVGYQATAVGYGKGTGNMAMQAQAVLIGADMFECEALAVVKGTVKRTLMNEEKNSDGTPKLNRDGKPRKPHFDIVIAVPDKVNNRWVDHVIKIYDGKTEPGKRGQIEQMKYRLKDFDYEQNGVAATFVTQPAEIKEKEYIKKNGETGVSYSAYHIGCIKMDFEYIGERTRAKENEHGTPAQVQPQAPSQPAPQASNPAPTPQPSYEAPTTGGNGFEAADSATAPGMEEMELFS